ncbi:iron-sulfur cluster assembly accessory protein [Pengzhenrongella sicca]|uniref:Adhesin n=1 Tax=Pengzhenrongella sicca TaxID=2819238 RepID=A0A8A4ZEF2_9MICO|nr:hypothetical protein [Pengzhenrongella sicca]QTE29685.1 hypothetical protein J4E96_01105 [Pengzhenrongella sicca]
MLTLTENARTTVDGLTTEAGLPDGGGLRIAASAAEDGGFDLALVAEPAPGDAVVQSGTTKVFLEPAASDALADHELDADPAQPGTSFTVVPQA